VMEYMPGGDLRTVIRSNGITVVQAAGLLANVAEGLQHAHRHGIVHRDIKPENILLGEHSGESIGSIGEAKIADFGLARLPRAAGAFRTRSGERSGTPAYMAPEQITAPDLESPAIDTYSFSVLAYELLTGVLPFPRRDLAAMLDAHLHDAPAPPWDVAPGFPIPAGRVLLAGLAKDPADRPTLTELTSSLRGVSATEWEALGRATTSSTRSAATPSQLGTGTTGTTGIPGPTGHATEAKGSQEAAASDSIETEGPQFPAVGEQLMPVRPIVVHPPDASARPAWQLAVPIYRPPKPPLIRRRATYLSLAFGVGSALGVVLILLARLR
jgi:serine/threonine protein kinase